MPTEKTDFCPCPRAVTADLGPNLTFARGTGEGLEGGGVQGEGKEGVITLLPLLGDALAVQGQGSQTKMWSHTSAAMSHNMSIIAIRP